jgi:hypothetical protein
MLNNFRAPARASSSQMGKPVRMTEVVPGGLRFNYKHKIFWSARHHKTADMYNSAAAMYDIPCYRRWLEFKGSKVPRNYPYRTPYNPPSITSNPPRTWTLVRGNEEICTFTNLIEAWLLCLGASSSEPFANWAVIFRDRRV